MDKEKYLQELLKWVSSDSLLVIDNKGALRRIYCPFKVVSLVDYISIRKWEKVTVEAIKLTVKIREVYIIMGVAYYFVDFVVILDSLVMLYYVFCSFETVHLNFKISRTSENEPC